jgi:hypothetical protein
MKQADARRRAKIISAQTGRIAVADTFRVGLLSGRIIRGGWPHPLQTWGVFDYETGEMLAPTPAEDRERTFGAWT